MARHEQENHPRPFTPVPSPHPADQAEGPPPDAVPVEVGPDLLMPVGIGRPLESLKGPDGGPPLEPNELYHAPTGTRWLIPWTKGRIRGEG
jgi:hypothetical protein